MTRFRRGIFGVVCLVLAIALMAMPAIPRADAQTPGVIISEFLAINSSTSTDNTGQYEDWIELLNTSGSTIDLGGWTISDSGTAFSFPAGTTIASGEYKVVWASGDTNRTTAAEIHLPFKLSGSGEALILTNTSGIFSSPAWAAPYPVQLADDSYGVTSSGQVGYFTDPTPGAANGTSQAGLVAPVTFSVDHGFYASAQSVVLSSPTPGVTIRYTTNGDSPTPTTGTAITPGSTVTVAQTTTLRAVAYRDGWITSPLETRSYLFTGDIVTQGTTTPEGWPDHLAINDMAAHYGIDPTLSGAQLAVVEQALVAIPSVSITTDLPNLFDPATGIWSNPAERGSEWEAPVSIELIDPTGAQAGFEINGGVRIRGNSSRNPNNFKHSMRLVFDNVYGDGELEYPLFGAEGVDRFENVDLKTAQSWSWHRPGQQNPTRGPHATWLRDVWNLDSQGAMGQPYARTDHVHLYLNGQYFGLYMFEERVSNQHAAQYFGGAESDFDIIKRRTEFREFATALDVEARDGTLDDWLSLWPLVEDHTLSDAEWAVFKDEVDVVNLADYYLLSFYSGDSDGTPRYTLDLSNNWLAFRNRARVGDAAKWQFNDRDSESALCTNSNVGREPDWNPTPPWNLDDGLGDYLPPQYFLAPSWLFEAALTQPEFVQVFKDRVQLHMLTPGGALTVPESIARLDARANVVDLVIDAESARWGDTVVSPAFDRSDWESATQVVRDCFQLRTTVMETYLREDGLWPLADPPTISPAAGAVPFATSVAINSGAQAGTLYFTTDGSDPTGANDAPSPTATVYSGPISISDDVTIRARIDLGGGIWSTLAEATYTLSTPAGPVPMALNEFNAVSSSNFLGGGTAANVANGVDATLGRVAGNGGDWFELVVIEDHLDIRGWTVDVWDSGSGFAERSASLTFTNDDLFSDLLAGTIITISEDIADDDAYNPIQGDWHINLQSNDAGAGAYITASSQTNFAINNDDTQIALYNAAAAPVQLRTGEATAPAIAVNNTEVFKLDGTPTALLTHDSPLYADGTTSTWGLPNEWAAGTQDLSDLRIFFGDVNCDDRVSIADAVVIAQYTVGIRSAVATCPLPNPTTQIFQPAADVSGNDQITVADAVLIAQCTVGLVNSYCPTP